jgi:hypothetical protein
MMVTIKAKIEQRRHDLLRLGTPVEHPIDVHRRRRRHVTKRQQPTVKAAWNISAWLS